MDEPVKLAFQFARDLATQLITLSSGVLALSITFNKDVIKTAPKRFGWVLWAAWVCLLFSILTVT